MTTYPSAVLVSEAGCTYRQLEYWCQVGWFGEQNVGMGTGRRRAFTEDDVVFARRLVEASRLARLPLYELVARLEAAGWWE